MENIVPYLIVAAGLIYKVYQNFQQEQEKARKRNPSQPITKEQKPDVKPKPPQTLTKPQPVFEEQTFDPKHPYEPKYEPTYKREPAVKRYRAENRYETISPEVVETTEYYNPEKPALEIRKSRSIHKPHGHKFVPYTEVEEQSEYANFDLRDAIIKSAILQRPEY